MVERSWDGDAEPGTLVGTRPELGGARPRMVRPSPLTPCGPGEAGPEGAYGLAVIDCSRSEPFREGDRAPVWLEGPETL